MAKTDRELIYLSDAAKINNVIETSFNYITNFSAIVGEKISLEHSLNPEKIGKILKETYEIAQLNQEIVATLTKFYFYITCIERTL